MHACACTPIRLSEGVHTRKQMHIHHHTFSVFNHSIMFRRWSIAYISIKPLTWPPLVSLPQPELLPPPLSPALARVIDVLHTSTPVPGSHPSTASHTGTGYQVGRVAITPSLHCNTQSDSKYVEKKNNWWTISVCQWWYDLTQSL